ncbi:MAG: hypothetical protein ACXWV6_04325 [Chitinophagaceae bacterium]
MPVKPDKRKHIFLSNNDLIEKLERVKHIEKISFDEVLEKYLKLPESEDIIHDEFIDVEKLIVQAYGKKDQEFKQQKLRILMELFWVLIIQSAKGNFDIEKLLRDIYADFEVGTYKKR